MCLHVCLHIQDALTCEKWENESYREGENRPGGNGKMQVVCACAYSSVHLKSINIPWTTSAVRDKGHLCGGKKRASIQDWATELDRILGLSQDCFHGSVKGGVSDVLQLFHILLLANDYFIYIYMWLMCFNISSFCLAFFPLLRVLGLKKAALTRWRNVPRWCRGSRKKEIKRRNHGSMCEEERYVGHSRCG